MKYPKQIERILVLKLDFIGDFITILPALRQLRQNFPQAKISLVCAPVIKDIAERIGYFDKIYIFEFFGVHWSEKELLFAAFEKAAGGIYDLAIDFRVDADTRPLLQIVNADIRAGIGTSQDFPFLDIALPSNRAASQKAAEKPKQGPVPPFARFFTVCLRVWWTVSFVPRLVCRMILDTIRYVDFLLRKRTLVWDKPVPPVRRQAKPDLWIGENILLLIDLCVYRLSGAEFFLAKELLQPVSPIFHPATIYIAPFSNSEIRSWPATYFRQLIFMILERTQFNVVMLGPAQQRSAIDSLISTAPALRAKNMAGLLDLAQIAAALGNGSLLVANNSGLAHLGAAVGAKVLAIYSASHEISEWGPRGPHVVTLTAEVDCRGCSLETIPSCENDHICMKLITPDLVFRYIDHIFSDSDRSRAPVLAGIRSADGCPA